MMKKNILIVDDLELNREILSLILKDNYNTIEAENGLAAKNILIRENGNISLILLDILMPVMGGFEFLEEIQTDDRFKDIPIIFVTAETYEGNIQRAIQYGVRDVIAKPFDPYFVCKRVNHLIQLTRNRETAPIVKPQASQRLTALIVDDMDLNRTILRAALDSTYDILEAVHGREALLLLERHRDKIGVILLDIVMPIMDGIETMKEIHKRNLLDDIPVLAITAEESRSKIDEVKELGICEVIHKPFNPDIVKNRVDYLVELSRCAKVDKTANAVK